ncbi:MAG: hypothetical protein NUV75_12450 [Gallionella sp.]|nr:hypothetical protein [Gallionella sp.]
MDEKEIYSGIFHLVYRDAGNPRQITAGRLAELRADFMEDKA